MAIVNLFYWRFHHGACVMGEWRFHSKRLPIVVSATATSPKTCVLGLVAAALTTKVKNKGLKTCVRKPRGIPCNMVKSEGSSPSPVIYTCTAPFRSAYVTLWRHVLQGIPLGFRTQVFRPSFFTFVISAAATSPITHVLGLAAAALMTPIRQFGSTFGTHYIGIEIWTISFFLQSPLQHTRLIQVLKQGQTNKQFSYICPL